MIKFIITGLSVLVSQSFADCGPPGQSRRSLPAPDSLIDSGVYPENHQITYNCDNPLIGTDVRVCRGGRWTKPIPKCRKCCVMSFLINKLICN